MKTKIMATAAGAAILALGIAMPAASDAATVSAHRVASAACTLYAEQPIYNGSINGSGYWSGCPATAKVTVVLREDRKWWPDRTLRSASGTGSSGSKLLVYPCGTDFDPIKVFVEVRYGSLKKQSPRAVLPCA